MKATTWIGLAVILIGVGFGLDARANSCSGVCGDTPDGACYCDDMCFDYGDCCGDVCSACPTLAGCGGGGAVCGNGSCEAGEDASTCPADCGGGGGCGSVSFEGCCQGETLQYCDGGQLQTLDCSQSPSCGWQPDGPYYDCGTSGGADPSGVNPKACSGGTNPICGNGSCELGETSASCPADCGGGTSPVCGNGTCENGETAATCPNDCSGGNTGCTGKECGFDSQGNSCGSCPDGFYCNYEGQCESDTPCEPVCPVGQQCGDDGCGGSCGTCPAGLVCSASNTCISPYGQDLVTEDPDVSCTPDCTGKVCGGDGCGGQCGTCPMGYGCTEAGMCQEGYVAPEDDATTGDDPYVCPEGQELMYGKCVAIGDDDSSGGGCSTGHANPVASALLLLLLAGLVAARRRIA